MQSRRSRSAPFSSLMRFASTSPTATRWRRKPSATRLSISRFCSRRCWSIITFSVVLAACTAGGPKFKSTDITGVDYGKSLELADTRGRLRHLEDFRGKAVVVRSEEHTSELQSRQYLVCRLLLEKKKNVSNLGMLSY